MAAGRQHMRHQRLDGWFRLRASCHFDTPLSYEKASAYASDPSTVEQHAFLPFIEFSIVDRCFKRSPGNKHPAPFSKSRKLSVASHVDGYIFALYANNLRQRYEEVISSGGFQSSVLSDRVGKGNVPAMAKSAFMEITARTDCLVLSLDIKDFFPSINHKELKRNWARILGVSTLPKDHYQVFRALTKSAVISKEKCYVALGVDPKRRPSRWRLCSISEFRKLRGLITVNTSGFGIPQGSQMTGIIANLALLAFDETMVELAFNLGGSYRRYIDDLLFIINTDNLETAVMASIEQSLRTSGEQFVLNSNKTEVVRFSRSPDGKMKADQRSGIQYLGFTFDGERTLIRSKTLSRHARRLVYAVRKAKKAASENGKKTYRRSIYRRFAQFGRANFVSDYVKVVQELMPGDGIRRQFRNYKKRLQRLLR